MMIKTCLCTLALLWLPLVDAQYGGGGSSSSTTPTTTTASSTNTASASSTIQSVDVGKSGFTFNPDTIHVPAGGVVEFHFYPGAHSVAQAAFNNPCHPMSDTSFFSGFMTSANNGQPVWSLTVNDTNPIWFYCGQVGHCQAGMVGVINPSGSDTLDLFKSAASNANGQSVPSTAQGGISGTPSAGQTTATASSTTTTSSTSPASGTQTSSGASSPSATSIADILHVSADLSVLSIFTLIIAMLLI